MSCGKPHDTPCTEVLDRVYGYLDGEIGAMDCAKIKEHLDECGPCLREYGLEEAVKRLVAKHCGCDPVPSALRDKVLVRIREVQATIEFVELRIVAKCDKLM
ncbi:MAG TPA: mycothiol system anti-sigma-R factor [Streptosporangiaceae bacterium]|jgi:mycothiol system anti-sigma-R factor